MENNGNHRISATLEHLVAMEKEKLSAWQKELDGLPEGSLRCLCRGKNTFFYHAVGDKRTGITRDLDRVYVLARKKYLNLLINGQEKMLEEARIALSGKRCSRSRALANASPLEKLLDYYGRLGLDVARITCTREQYMWMKKTYYQNPRDPHKKVYETYSGIRVRSKSEQSIGNSMERRGIPYRYEPGIRLNVDWMEDVPGMDGVGDKVYFPDFIILTASGDIIVWEHLGRVDLKSYREHNMEKIAAYRQSGMLDDNYLILTYEKDMESPKILDHIIDKRIMPFM